MSPLDLTTLHLAKGSHNSPAEGACLLDQARAILGTYPGYRAAYTTPVFTRLFSRCVESDNGCWEWQGSKNADGYGTISARCKQFRTHRVVWQLIFGEIGNLHVCHSCDNPSCCNPEHLFLGTNQQNMQDRQSKGRTKNIDAGRAKHHAAMRSITHCPKGHEYSGTNVRFRLSGARYCAECYRIRNSLYRKTHRNLINQKRRLTSAKGNEVAS